VNLHERDQCRRDQQLVGDRIEQRPHGRDLLPAARQVAIQQIRRRGGQENRQRQEAIADYKPRYLQAEMLLHERRHQHRHEEDAQQCQQIRQVHSDPSTIT
jgi:hypothetical protein